MQNSYNKAILPITIFLTKIRCIIRNIKSIHDNVQMSIDRVIDRSIDRLIPLFDCTKLIYHQVHSRTLGTLEHMIAGTQVDIAVLVVALAFVGASLVVVAFELA